MSLLHYETGEIVKAQGRRVEILSIESPERILCRDLNTGKEQYFSAQELENLDGKSTEKKAIEDSGVLDEKERTLRTLDKVISEHFETNQKPTMARTIGEVRRQFLEQGKKPPSATTIRTHIKLRDQR